MSTPSIVPPTKDEVEEWVKWSLTLTHPNDPFDPSDGGRNWDRNQKGNEKGSVIFLAAVAATEPPPNQASNRTDPNNPEPLRAVLYHQDDGRATGQRPGVVRREITIDKNDKRNILIPVLTEAACEVKYRSVRNRNALARAINNEERDNGILSALIEFGNERYSGNDLNNFLQEGNISNVGIPQGNVFHQPVGTDTTVDYNCYCAILKSTSLGSRNLLKFSGGNANGRNKFRYEAEYTINVM